MIKRTVAVALACSVCLLMGTAIASAQATRTWVSGVGDDVNPCSRTAPCKTFAGAISKTAAGGEISVLDPGGYGSIVIAKSMTISGIGQQAGILGSGVNGVTINAGVNDVVTLRNLQINGAGSGVIGVRVLAGAAVVIDHVNIYGFDTGVEVNAANVTVVRSVISNSRSIGLHSKGGSLTVEGSTIVTNNIGVQATAPGIVRLSDNGIYNNLTGFGCGGGTLASTGDNRKGGNAGGTAAACVPTVVIAVQ